MGCLRWGWVGAVFLLVIGAAGAEPLRGGGRVSQVSVAAGLLVVDATALRLERATRVYDYAGQPVAASALGTGMSVSYRAEPPAQPGQPPVVSEVRMVPN